MNDSEIQRLRRLPLVGALVVLSWTIAGVAIESPARITPFGLPFELTKPQLLPIGLIIASLYGAARYFYYAQMLGTSPHRNRRDIMDTLVSESETHRKGLRRLYWGPTEFTLLLSFRTLDDARDAGDKAIAAFPKFMGSRPKYRVHTRPNVDQDGNDYTEIVVGVSIPRRCRAAALLQDLDYSSPTWLPIVATVLFLVNL